MVYYKHEKEINIKPGMVINKNFTFFNLSLAFICILCYIIDEERRQM